jgi:hypothetical protein
LRHFSTAGVVLSGGVKGIANSFASELSEIAAAFERWWHSLCVCQA